MSARLYITKSLGKVVPARPEGPMDTKTTLELSKLRHRLFWLPGEPTSPQNRPTLRLANSPAIQAWTEKILH
jgi:hypothetical protein